MKNFITISVFYFLAVMFQIAVHIAQSFAVQFAKRH